MWAYAYPGCLWGDQQVVLLRISKREGLATPSVRGVQIAEVVQIQQFSFEMQSEAVCA